MTKEAIKQHQKLCQEKREEFLKANYLGPWMDEPDRVQFRTYGLDCLLIRQHPLMHWCGYVGVPKNHPAFGVDYHKIEVDVHGGLTYGAGCGGHICHMTDEEHDLYWLGFDCAHSGDLSPGLKYNMNQIRKMPEFPEALAKEHETIEALLAQIPQWARDTYKDLDYVIKETKSLALQLSQMTLQA